MGRSRFLSEMYGRTDVTVRDNGSVWLFVLHTDAARTWVGENVQIESHMLAGKIGFYCEHRFVSDIRQGMADAGLEVS